MPYHLATPQCGRKQGIRETTPIPCLYLGWEMGLEPTTPGTTIRCSNQLSYTHHMKADIIATRRELVRQKGLEPLAHCLEGSCSIQLSYWRECVEQVTRIELASPAWKAGALTIVLHLRLPSVEPVSLVRIPCEARNVNRILQISQKFFKKLRKALQSLGFASTNFPSFSSFAINKKIPFPCKSTETESLFIKQFR